jgi:hypothetical protein
MQACRRCHAAQDEQGKHGGPSDIHWRLEKVQDGKLFICRRRQEPAE